MKVTYYIFGLVGLALAACAAYVSVTGWAQVFAGSALTVTIIMAVIEAGKVTAASLAYRLREVAPRSLTALLVATTVVTMALTSMGIYGFFSKAYQTSASEVAQKEAKIEALESEKQQYKNRVASVDEERERLSGRLDQAQDRVETLTQQYNERGWATDKQALDEAQGQVQNMRNRLSSRAQLSLALSDSLASVNQELTELRTTSTDAEAKLSAVQFAADISKFPRETIANFFILAIVFVFDPAAIAIIIATNVAAEKSGQGGFFEETITGGPDSEELYEQAREGYQKAIEEGGDEDADRLDKDPDESVEEVKEENNTSPVPNVNPIEREPSAAEVMEELGKPLPETEEEAGKSMGEGTREIRNRNIKNMPLGAAGEAVRERKEDLEENEPEPASFHLISWLQREPDNVLTTHRDWKVVGDGAEGDIQDYVDVIDPDNVRLPEEAERYLEEEEAEDYVEHELDELSSPDSIREEVNRIIGKRGSGAESDNRYIIRANGGVDHNPSREGRRFN